MVPAAKTAATTTVRFRTAPNVDVSSVALTDADSSDLTEACPWREFHWRARKKHYWGTYWLVAEGRHVVYEPRLEFARLRPTRHCRQGSGRSTGKAVTWRIS
jgi:hypothetical protein